MVIVSFICGTVAIVIGESLDSIADQRSKQQAVRVAHQNMETILAQEEIEEFSETGMSELYPDIEWTKGVEVVEFSGTGKLWMKAVSSANFYDSDNEIEEITFENWLAPLTRKQERLVQEDREKEEEYLEELDQQEQEEQEKQDQEDEEDEDSRFEDDQNESRSSEGSQETTDGLEGLDLGEDFGLGGGN